MTEQKINLEKDKDSSNQAAFNSLNDLTLNKSTDLLLQPEFQNQNIKMKFS